jgi:putative SOS response-associated peptidase YedK
MGGGSTRTDDRLTAYPVSNRVNSPAHDDAECIEPLAG